MKKRRLNMAGTLIKGLLIAIGATLLGMLAMAAVVIFVGMPDMLIRVLNQVLKIGSVVLGTFFAIRRGGERGLISGAGIGAVYAFAGYALYILLGSGAFDITGLLGEMLICTAAGAAAGALIVNISPAAVHK